jgi:hypothetical protein
MTLTDYCRSLLRSGAGTNLRIPITRMASRIVTSYIARATLLLSLAALPLLSVDAQQRRVSADAATSYRRIELSEDHPEPSSAPFLFTENIGQWNHATLMQGRGGSVTFRFTRSGVDYFYSVDSLKHRTDRSPSLPVAGHALRTEFIGARSDLRVEGENPAATLYNYYLGPEPSQWHVGARAFRQVRYRGLYSGIDALYYGRDGSMKYDFIIAPGGDYRQIVLRYKGAEKMQLTGKGELEVTTAFGAVREARPYSYQEIDGKRVTVEAEYRLQGGSEYGFALGEYDPRYPVVIDPCLSVEYATFLGGGGYDAVTGLAVDSAGFAYATGITRAPDFPIVPDSGQLAQRNYVFISKLSSDGSKLIYSTMIAPTYNGPYRESPISQLFESIGEDVEVTRTGEAVVAMTTNIAGLPTTSGAYMRSHAQNDPGSFCGIADSLNFDTYITRVDGSGRIVWGTYLGGKGNDYVSDLALDAGGDVYLTGLTYSPVCAGKGDTLAFPVTVPRTSFTSSDTLQGFETFVSRLSSDGKSLSFSGVYGGKGSEFAGRIAVTSAGKIILLGSTSSPDLPTTANAYQPAARPGLGSGVYDLYIARFDPAAGAMEYSSYFSDNGGAGRRGLGVGAFTMRDDAPLLGFERQDRRQGLLIDPTDGVIIFGGSTRSTSLPVTSGAFMAGPRNPGGDPESSVDCYIVRLNMNTNTVLAATYLGGTGFDGLGGMTFDSFGDVAIALSTASSDFPLSPIAIQRELRGKVDAAIAVISPDLRSFQYGSYMGGTAGPASQIWEQSVYGITLDRVGALYMFGGTGSVNFPVTAGALMKENDYFGGFIVKFAPPGSPQLGGASSIEFDLSICDTLQFAKQLIFNSGQTPARIESITFRSGKNYYLVNPPGYPLMLAPCDTLSINVGFRPQDVDCNRRVFDTLVITSSNTTTRDLLVPVRGTKLCISLGINPTSIVDSNFRYGSQGVLRFNVTARGDVTQYVTIEPRKGSGNIFRLTPPVKDMPFTQGTSTIGFGAFPPDTGYYCETFDVTIQPCNRKMTLSVCAYFRSGIYSGPSEIDLGLMSCREIIYPFVVRNVGNDSLAISLAFVGGQSPDDVLLDSTLVTRRKLGPHDSTLYQARVWPTGVGRRRSIIVMRTDDPSHPFPWIVINTELDSVAFRLSTTNLVGGFGDILSLPISYEPIVEGRVPTTELTFFVAFNPRMLDVQGVDGTGTLTQGWELVDRRVVHGRGMLLTLRMGGGGKPLAGSGRLTNLQMKVLRSDSISTPLDIRLAGVSRGCMTAEIDSGFAFQLSAECAAHSRLVYTGNELLKQSLPNPAHDVVRIPFRVPEAGHVTLTIYDAAGREVVRLIDEERPVGDTGIDVDTGDLPAGRYFYRLTVGTWMTDTREMVIER